MASLLAHARAESPPEHWVGVELIEMDGGGTVDGGIGLQEARSWDHHGKLGNGPAGPAEGGWAVWGGIPEPGVGPGEGHGTGHTHAMIVAGPTDMPPESKAYFEVFGVKKPGLKPTGANSDPIPGLSMPSPGFGITPCVSDGNCDPGRCVPGLTPVRL
jgi:hypothetical protein